MYKIFITQLLILSFLPGFAQTLQGDFKAGIQQKTDDPVYDKLVRYDEFNEDGALDASKWFHQTLLPNGHSWYNGEIQHYTNRIENTFVEKGIMYLVAKKENLTYQGVIKQSS